MTTRSVSPPPFPARRSSEELARSANSVGELPVLTRFGRPLVVQAAIARLLNAGAIPYPSPPRSLAFILFPRTPACHAHLCQRPRNRPRKWAPYCRGVATSPVERAPRYGGALPFAWILNLLLLRQRFRKPLVRPLDCISLITGLTYELCFSVGARRGGICDSKRQGGTQGAR